MLLPKFEQSVFETILARRSVRSYKPQPVATDVLKTILEAAIWAPTAMHKEPWGFVIVQNKALLKQLSDRAKPLFIEELKKNGMNADIWINADSDLFYDAGTLIIICGRANSHLAAADCWMAAENMMLAACAMNCGTCVIASALHSIVLPEVKSILGIPEDYKPVAPIIVGYPRAESAAGKRRAPLILNTIN
jgi:nitroreductase